MGVIAILKQKECNKINTKGVSKEGRFEKQGRRRRMIVSIIKSNNDFHRGGVIFMIRIAFVAIVVLSNILVCGKEEVKATLSQKWKIIQASYQYHYTNPITRNDPIVTLELNYTVSDFITGNDMVHYTLYDKDCNDGGNDLSSTMIVDDDDNPIFSVAQTNELSMDQGNGLENRTIQLDIDIDLHRLRDVALSTTTDDAGSGSGSAIRKLYVEEDYHDEKDDVEPGSSSTKKKATIIFCVRLALFTPPDYDPYCPNYEPVEVHFLQSLVSLTAVVDDVESSSTSLSPSFNVIQAEVNEEIKCINVASQSYFVDGYLCNEEFEPIIINSVEIPPYYHFDENNDRIRICIRPDVDARNDGVYMMGVQSLQLIPEQYYVPPLPWKCTFDFDLPEGHEICGCEKDDDDDDDNEQQGDIPFMNPQNIIKDGSPVNNDQNTKFHCGSGWKICMVEIIMTSSWKQRFPLILDETITALKNNDEINNTVVIVAYGNASLQFGETPHDDHNDPAAGTYLELRFTLEYQSSSGTRSNIHRCLFGTLSMLSLLISSLT